MKRLSLLCLLFAVGIAGCLGKLEEEVETNVHSVEGKQVAEKLNDPAFAGMVNMGTQEGWSAYFDKKNELVVLSNNASSLTISPSDFEDDRKLQALVRSGVPEEVIESWQGTACRAACWAAASAGCAAISAACAVGTTVTIGSFALPCSWAIIAACGAAGAGASVCSDYCTSTFG